MSTSAQQQHASQVGDLMLYTGTLLADAQARWHIEPGTLRSLPTLCMDIELDNGIGTHMHVEQPFAEGHHAQCKAAARRHKKGERVTVQAPLRDLRLIAANAAHIHVINLVDQASTEAPAS